MTDRPDPIAIDVGEVLRTATSLRSNLITRPTGRAVRLAIQTQLQGVGTLSVSVIDFSEVALIDFSCADEVVAKLLQEYLHDEVRDAFFVLRGVHDPHRDQIEEVLDRHGLAAVVETDPGTFLLLGVRSEPEESAWGVLEEQGRVDADEVEAVFGAPDGKAALSLLVTRGLAFRSPKSGRFHSLSRLVEELM